MVGNDTPVALSDVTVSGTLPKTLLVRAVGPALAQFVVISPL